MKLIPISYQQTLPIRQAILRPHQSEAECVYPGDDIAGHFGFREGSDIVAILSVFPENEKGEFSNAHWRIRGVATEENYRRQGLASALLKAAEDHVVKNLGAYIWCNARVSAHSFYLYHGYRIEGDMFDISGIGDHYRMLKTLA